MTRTTPCPRCKTPVEHDRPWWQPVPYCETCAADRDTTPYRERWQDRERWDWRRDVRAATPLHEIRRGR